jgi:segregation and condensation protein B
MRDVHRRMGITEPGTEGPSKGWTHGGGGSPVAVQSGGGDHTQEARGEDENGRPSRERGEGSVEIRNAIECLLLSRGGPVRLSELRKVLEIDEGEVLATLAALQVEYEGRGLQIQEIADGYQLCTRPAYGAYVQRLLRLDELEPLTRATLEVLAIVAYRQPMTRAEVDGIRGVHSAHHIAKLQDRRLIREVGRRPGPGRPILYGTTEGFLRYFGLKDLSALPTIGDRELAAALAAQGS